jgi:hypothetical protein
MTVQEATRAIHYSASNSVSEFYLKAGAPSQPASARIGSMDPESDTDAIPPPKSITKAIIHTLFLDGRRRLLVKGKRCTQLESNRTFNNERHVSRTHLISITDPSSTLPVHYTHCMIGFPTSTKPSVSCRELRKDQRQLEI